MIKPLSKNDIDNIDAINNSIVTPDEFEFDRGILDINNAIQRAIIDKKEHTITNRLVEFEIWGFSKHETVVRLESLFKEAGWDVDFYIWYSFNHRANIRLVL